MTSAFWESKERDQAYGSRKVKVTILASEWGLSKGGLSTISPLFTRELAIQLAKFPDVEITYFLLKCSKQDTKEALGHKINIVEATRRPGFEELEWLTFPPEHLQIDVIVGHGVRVGRQAQIIRDSHKCKWVQVVQTDPYLISEDERKRQIEVELCVMADFVVGLGSKSVETIRSFFHWYHKVPVVLDLTPGLFDEFLSFELPDEKRGHCSILVFGRGDEDFTSRGINLVGRAVALLPDTQLVFLGAPDGKKEEIAQRLLGCGISDRQLIVRGYPSSRDRLRDMFCAVDMVLMPSTTEGFGLTGLGALSAGLPVLISKNSGFGEALSKVPSGLSVVIDSEDPKVWATAIKDIWSKDRQTRLEEAKLLRSSYNKIYSWAKQSKVLLEKMFNLVHGSSSRFQSSTNSERRFSSPPAWISQDTDVATERHKEIMPPQTSREASLMEQLQVKERQLRERDQQVTNLQVHRERAAADLQVEQQKVAKLEKQLRDRDQDIVELRNALSAAKQRLSTNESQLKTRDWVISRNDIQETDKCLGSGGLGRVLEGRYCGCAVAIKQLHHWTLSPDLRKLFEREMDIASRCRHPCLLQFIGATQDDGNHLLVTELMEKSLRALLLQPSEQQLTDAEIAVIALDVALGLNYLHQRKPTPIVHRDVSSANVLLWIRDKRWRGKLSDYGTARFVGEVMTRSPGAMIYSAPEAATSLQTVKVDVYSFGVLLCEMCTRELPNVDRRDEQVAMMTNRVFQNLVRRCLQRDPDDRPNMEEIIEELEQFQDTS